MIECARCKNLNAPDATRCSSCGAPLAIAAPFLPPEPVEPERVEPESIEREPQVVAESPQPSQPEPEEDELVFPETVADEPPVSGEPVTAEQGQIVVPPPSPPRHYPWLAIILGAVAVAALIVAIAALISSKRPVHHHRPRTVFLVSPAPTAYRPLATRPAPEPTRRLVAQQLPIRAPAVKPALTQTTAPAVTAVATPTPPPATPTPEAVAAVTITSFRVVRSLPRRVCLGYEVKNATYISITNESTGLAFYSRDLSGEGVATNPGECIFVKRAGVKGPIGFELSAHGRESHATRYLVAPAYAKPGETGQLR